MSCGNGNSGYGNKDTAFGLMEYSQLIHASPPSTYNGLLCMVILRRRVCQFQRNTYVAPDMFVHFQSIHVNASMSVSVLLTKSQRSAKNEHVIPQMK